MRQDAKESRWERLDVVDGGPKWELAKEGRQGLPAHHSKAGAGTRRREGMYDGDQAEAEEEDRGR